MALEQITSYLTICKELRQDKTLEYVSGKQFQADMYAEMQDYDNAIICLVQAVEIELELNNGKFSLDTASMYKAIAGNLKA